MQHYWSRASEVVLFIAALFSTAAAAAAQAAPASVPTWDDLPPIRPAATDWPWWRGERFDGIAAAAKDPPITWSKTENVVWRADLPGRGSPTIWGDRIFLATADEKEKAQYILAHSRRDASRTLRLCPQCRSDRQERAANRQPAEAQHLERSHAFILLHEASGPPRA